jgi:predicted ATP-grasp superfamily ATP-dependent carboligase
VDDLTTFQINDGDDAHFRTDDHTGSGSDAEFAEQNHRTDSIFERRSSILSAWLALRSLRLCVRLMTVFTYEYICGGGMADRPLPESLAREGWAMLASIVEDFSRVEGCEVVTMLDSRFADRPLPARTSVPRQDDEPDLFRRLAADADWTLVIAPEFDGILLDRVRWVENVGGRLIGPSSRGVAATADKHRCAQLLARAGVPVVEGRIVQVGELRGARLPFPTPAVLKPRDGAGSQNTFLIPDSASVGRVADEAMASGLIGEALLQPFVSGLAASVSLLVGPNGPTPLLAGEQVLSRDGRFQYLGGRMPLPCELSRRALVLAARAAAAIPGLRGFVGVDLVLAMKNLESQLSDSELAHADVVIEINPRLTTSYVGVRALARGNLAEWMLRLARGKVIEPIAWRDGTIGFAADGKITYAD